MSALSQNEDQLKEFEENPNEGPVVMLNLLKFKADGGKESYAQYTKKVATFLSGVGAEMIFLGKAKEMLQGTETWDVVMLVRYPSRRALMQMGSDPGFQEIHKYREEGLERAVLYATDEMTVRELFFAKK